MTGNTPQISVAEAKALLDSARLGQRTLLDVRQDFEYAEGHLPGATLIPLPQLADRAGELDPALPAVVYCRSGRRSLAAANLLSGLGFQDVVSMQGGILAWEGAQAAGPVDFGLSALLSAASAQEVLERAWGMELALGEYYGALAARSSEPDLAALFERLAGFEERHRRTLTEIWKRLGAGEVQDFESRARRAVAPGTLEGGISAQDYLGQLGDPTSTSAALELAMAVEAQAMDLYLRRSKVEFGVENGVENGAENGTEFGAEFGAEPEAELRRTLVLLAEEEKAHLKVLGSFVDSRKGF